MPLYYYRCDKCQAEHSETLAFPRLSDGHIDVEELDRRIYAPRECSECSGEVCNIIKFNNGICFVRGAKTVGPDT